MFQENKNSLLTSASNQIKSNPQRNLSLKGFGFLSISLFTLFLISGCPETIKTVTGPTVTITNFPPLLVSNQAIVFTYNSHASFELDNKGGVVESCVWVANESNALPVGLSVGVSNGECVIAGTSTALTLRENVSSTTIRVGTTSNTQTVSYTNLLIVSVPVLVAASNGNGISQVPINLSVQPISVSGDLSLGIVHISNTGLTGRLNSSNLIYKADNLPFAFGGTGAYNDPLLIYVDEGAKGLSFVVDFNDVNIPVSNFASLTNDSHKEFYISFLNVNPPILPLSLTREDNNIPKLTIEIIDNNGFEEIFFYGIGIVVSSPIRFLQGESAGIINTREIARSEPIATLHIRSHRGTQISSNLEGGIFRISLLNLDAIPPED